MSDATLPATGEGRNGSVAPSVAECAAYALTGQFLGSRLTDDAQPGQLVAFLGKHGWPVARLAQFRDERRRDGLGWPLPLPQDVAAPGGFAQFHAWLAAVVAELGLDSHDAGVRDASQPVDAETRRLMAELPPHYGSAG